METEIHTARLRLRRNRPGDGGAMHAIFADFEVARMTAAWPWPPERAFSASRCTPLQAAASRGRHGHPPDRWHHRHGLRHCPAALAQGLCHRDGPRPDAHIRAAYDWHEISAGVLADNPASMRVREKLRFERPGPMTCAAAVRGPTMYPAVALRLSRCAVRP